MISKKKKKIQNSTLTTPLEKNFFLIKIIHMNSVQLVFSYFHSLSLCLLLQFNFAFQFQANSWKSLILKICQGSMSPLPSHYSYELQLLIKQMFKKNPCHRPSATTLLSRGSLARLIQKCLPPEVQCVELTVNQFSSVCFLLNTITCYTCS